MEGRLTKSLKDTEGESNSERRSIYFDEIPSIAAREKWMVKDEDDRGMGLKFWGDKP